MDINKKLYEKYHSETSIQKKYPKENNFTHYYSFMIIREYLKNVRNALELGCGAGTNLFFLAKHNINITGVDISEKAIFNCNESAKYMRIRKAKFINEDILKFRSKIKYDLIVCFEVLEHLQNDIACINLIYGLLNNNGTALISVPSKNSVIYRLGLLKKNERVIGHLRRYDKDEIVETVYKTKFKISEIKLVEGPIRDIFFHIRPFGIFIRYFRGPISNIVNSVDQLFAKLFGESRIIVVLQK